jgi:uncharacterized protein
MFFQSVSLRQAPLVAIATLLFSCASPLPEDLLHVHDVQGAGHRSPLEGELVENLIGVVTATTLRSFYMQSVAPDTDPATSEGILVETIRPPAVEPGAVVLVAGRVVEEYPAGVERGDLSVTTIVRPAVTDTGRTMAVPAPIVIGVSGRHPPGEVIDDDYLSMAGDGGPFNTEEGSFDPDVDAIDFYESLEGMLVEVRDAVSVGVVQEAFGEIFVLPDNGRTAAVRTPRGGIVVREGDFNPERLLIDFKEEFPPYSPSGETGTPRIGVGDRFQAPIIGVVSYSYSNYKVLPLGPLPQVERWPLPRERVAPETDPSILSIAAFNVQNLSGASGAAKFQDIAETIVDGLGAPDIVALAEIQDSDGAGRDESSAADRTAARLLTALASAGGPPDYRYVDVAPQFNRDGGQPNANIRVAFLYRSGRVSLPLRGEPEATVAVTIVAGGSVEGGTPGSPALLPNPGRIAPQSRAFASSRKPLAAEFVFQGQPLFVVSSHFSSKGGDGGLFGRFQPPPLTSEVQRMLQAAEVASFVESLLVMDADARVVVAGDLNDFHFSPPLRLLEDAGLVNLAAELLHEREIYSYIYEGNSQVLDHILVSPVLLAGATVDYVHRYSEYLFSERHSDHDPVIARLQF